VRSKGPFLLSGIAADFAKQAGVCQNANSFSGAELLGALFEKMGVTGAEHICSTCKSRTENGFISRVAEDALGYAHGSDQSRSGRKMLQKVANICPAQAGTLQKPWITKNPVELMRHVFRQNQDVRASNNPKQGVAGWAPSEK
jgi:hypothetical protein